MDSCENKAEHRPSDALFGASSAALDPSANAALVEKFAKSRGNRIARNAVTSMDVMAVARNPVAMRTYSDTYRVAVKAPKTVTNQRQSGRCWMFSTLNTQRVEICRLLDVDDFEFSQAYGMFYDKLEKANAFWEISSPRPIFPLTIERSPSCWRTRRPMGESGVLPPTSSRSGAWCPRRSCPRPRAPRIPLR